MKTAQRFLVCFLFGIILLGCRTQETGTQRGMEFDRHVSMTEAEVRLKYGEPKQCSIVPAKDFTSQLHRPIYKKYVPHRLSTEIKEMCYELDGFQLFFWLENKRKQWRVVGDARFPKGVVF